MRVAKTSVRIKTIIAIRRSTFAFVYEFFSLITLWKLVYFRFAGSLIIFIRLIGFSIHAQGKQTYYNIVDIDGGGVHAFNIIIYGVHYNILLLSIV